MLIIGKQNVYVGVDNIIDDEFCYYVTFSTFDIVTGVQTGKKFNYA